MHRRIRLATGSLVALALGWLTFASAAGAATISVVVPMTGEQERPLAVITNAIGTVQLDFDTETNSVHVWAQVSGIAKSDLADFPGVGPFHIHVINDEINGTGPITVHFGAAAAWEQLFQGIVLHAAGILAEGASAQDLRNALFAGTAYFNLHTMSHLGGEIRGDIPAIPEPDTLALALLGTAGLGVLGRRRLAPARA